MRRQRIFFAAVLILGVGIASAVAFALAASEEQAPESLLPADSVVYFGWDGTEKHKAAWEKTACYEALDKTHLVKTLADFALSYIPADSPVPQEAVRQLFEGIARQGISVSATFPKEQTYPRVIVVLHRAAGLESGFNSAIPKLFAAQKLIKFETSTIRGRRVTRGILPSYTETGQSAGALSGSTGVVVSPGPELAWWADGGHLVLVFGEGAVEAALDVADGKSPPIIQSANWRKYREESSDFQAIAAAWCNVAALHARYGDYVMQEKTDRAPKFTVGELIDILGGERLVSVGMRCGLKDRAIVTDCVIDAPSPRTGILALADQSPITLAALPPLPKNTTGFGLASFNWSKAYDTILNIARNIADKANNNGSQQVDAVMQRAPEILGFDPKRELVDTLGHVACIYGDTAAGIPGGFGFTIALSVEKPDVLQKTLKTGFEKLQTVFPNGFNVAEEERSGRPVWVADMGGLPIHPAAALDKKWLWIGLTPQSIESALLRVDGKLEQWKPSEAEQAALDSVPKEFVGLSLTDPRPLYTAVVSYLPMVAGFINNAAEPGSGKARGRQSGGRMAILADIPPAEVITRPMFPNVTAVTVDAKGVRLQSRESAPGLSAGAFVGAPVMVALLLPAVQASREAARRTESRNHLKQLMLAMHNYHDVYKSFPQGTHPNPDLKPDKRLSWQTDLLPFLEYKPIYDLIDFKKAWDDRANKMAADSPLALFINPSLGPQKANGFPVTEYVGMAGVGADGPMLPVTSPRAGVFAYDRVTRLDDIKDGTSNTIAISECNKDLGSWAAGGRATIRSLTKKPYIDGSDGLGGHPEGCLMGFADGSVRFISKSIDAQTLEALMTINGHEPIRLPGQ
ncbi:MAG TPA: DUF1559 domain-containing protein [Planctomycetaceae bacterium]|jgi:hypothetical protein|nr:DUF1559 domain-containing protein [Planctomycetaceae bacterium]